MALQRTPVGERLPDFPWDSLAEAKATAQAHPDGIVDLSVGTPIDAVAPGIQLALSEGAAAPGYPQTKGTPELRRALVEAMQRRFHVTGLDSESSVPVSYTHLTLPTTCNLCRSRWSPYH